MNVYREIKHQTSHVVRDITADVNKNTCVAICVCVAESRCTATERDRTRKDYTYRCEMTVIHSTGWERFITDISIERRRWLLLHE